MLTPSTWTPTNQGCGDFSDEAGVVTMIVSFCYVFIQFDTGSPVRLLLFSHIAEAVVANTCCRLLTLPSSRSAAVYSCIAAIIPRPVYAMP